MRAKKLVSMLLALSLSVGMLAGCGTSGNDKKSSQGDKPYTGVTLKVWGGNIEINSTTRAIMDKATEKLGMQFEIEIAPSGSDGDNVLKTKLASGDLPDIFNYNSGSKFLSLNPTQYFADMTDQKMTARFDDNFKKCVSVNDKIYGAPFSTTQAGAIVYWKPDYESLGLKVPNTWDEFLKNCETLKKAGKTPCYLSNGDTWTTQVLFLGDNHNVITSDPNFAQEFEAGKAKFATTKAALESFRKYEDLTSYYNADGSAAKYQDGIEDMSVGKATHWIILTQAIGEMIAKHPDCADKLGVFPIPGTDASKTGLTVWEPQAWYVSKDSQQKEAAMAFLNFWYEDENVNEYVKAMGANGPSCLKGYKLPDTVCPAIRVDMQKYFDQGKTTPALEYQTPIKGNSCEQITSALSLGQLKGKDAAQRYDDDCKLSANQLGFNWK